MSTLLLVVGVSLGVLIMIFFSYFLMYKKIDVKGAFEKIESIAEMLETYISAGEKITTGKTKEIFDIADYITKNVEVAVKSAEDWFISSQITNDTDGSKRREFASNYIYALLKSKGVDINDNDVRIIVDGIIRKAVFSDKDMASINTKIDTVVSAQVTSLKKDITNLTSKNEELNKIVEDLKSQINKYDNEKTGLLTQIESLTNEKQTLTDNIAKITSVTNNLNIPNINQTTNITTSDVTKIGIQ